MFMMMAMKFNSSLCGLSGSANGSVLGSRQMQIAQIDTAELDSLPLGPLLGKLVHRFH